MTLPLSRERIPEFLVVLVAVTLLLFLSWVFWPGVSSRGEAGRRSDCRNNHNQIGLALHNYADAYGSFPPAYTVDAAGKPLHSWRTLILPYLDQQPLYHQIDLSKPWDDAANAEILKTPVKAYRCPSSDLASNHTTYLGVAARNGSFFQNTPRQFEDFTDGLAMTWIVIEVPREHAVPWGSPNDADEAPILSVKPQSKLPHKDGFHVLFADGRVELISADPASSERIAAISIAGNDN